MADKKGEVEIKVDALVDEVFQKFGPKGTAVNNNDEVELNKEDVKEFIR